MREGTAEAPTVATDPDGAVPAIDPADADLFLTREPAAPAPWVAVADVTAARDAAVTAAAATPVAAAILLRLLRATGTRSFDDALEIESLAFSTLLGGGEFRRWRGTRAGTPALLDPPHPVRFARTGDEVTLTLDDPASGNAFGAVMRDALADALDACLIDPTRPLVTVRSAGRAFCTGGALDEFGLATDLAAAHRIRRDRSAVARLRALGSRATVEVGGAAIGSGCEIAAAGARVRARRGAWFRLPELAMGLVPGAGGTITVPRRIGRHRACWMMLTGRRLSAQAALRWGLVDAVIA